MPPVAGDYCTAEPQNMRGRASNPLECAPSTTPYEGAQSSGPPLHRDSLRSVIGRRALRELCYKGKSYKAAAASTSKTYVRHEPTATQTTHVPLALPRDHERCCEQEARHCEPRLKLMNNCVDGSKIWWTKGVDTLCERKCGPKVWIIRVVGERPRSFREFIDLLRKCGRVPLELHTRRRVVAQGFLSELASNRG